MKDVEKVNLGFTFLTNHAHVLLLINRDTGIRMREIAMYVGVTERAVQRIVDDLTQTGFLKVTKEGRRNRYEVQMDLPMKHPVELGIRIRDLVQLSQE